MLNLHRQWYCITYETRRCLVSERRIRKRKTVNSKWHRVVLNSHRTINTWPAYKTVESYMSIHMHEKRGGHSTRNSFYKRKSRLFTDATLLHQLSTTVWSELKSNENGVFSRSSTAVIQSNTPHINALRYADRGRQATGNHLSRLRVRRNA